MAGLPEFGNPAICLCACQVTCLVPAYADVIYTASPDFLSNVQPGYYTETFDEDYGPMPPRDYGDGAFTFNASAAANLFQVRGVLSLVTSRVPLVIAITGADVNAIGGNFFITNGSGSFRPVGVSVTLSNGTTQTFTPATLEDSYRGFVTDTFITSLTIDIADLPYFYITLDNLTIGRAADPAAVPEPASLATVGAGLLGLAAVRRRKRRIDNN
jgi:hypothetical protein